MTRNLFPRKCQLGVALTVIVVVSGWSSSVSSQTTAWTNASGDSLWGTQTNWTSGVPTASSTANVTDLDTGLPTMDLGGATRSAAALFIQGHALNNGLLQTNVVSGEGIFNCTLSSIGSLMNLADAFASQFRGTIGDGLGGGSFSLVAVGSFSAPMTHFGTTFLPLGMTRLSGDAAISHSPSMAFEGGALTLENTSSTATLSRLPDAAPLHFKAGSLFLSGPTNEATGTIQLAGKAVIDTGTGSGGGPPSAILTARGLGRDRFAILELSTGINNTTRLKLSHTPAMSGGGTGSTQKPILPYVPVLYRYFDNGSPATEYSFATYDLGVRALDVDAEYVHSISPGTTLDNVRLTGLHELNGDSSINALAMRNATLTLNASNVTIQSGGLMLEARLGEEARIEGSGTLHFPDEALVFAESNDLNKRVFINTPIAAQSLVIAGHATTVLGRPNQYSGGTCIYAPVVTTSQGALGTASILLNDLWSVESVSQTYNNDLTFGLPLQNFRAHPDFGSVGISVSSGLAATLGGSITSNGMGLGKSGAGLLRLNGNTLVHGPATVTMSDGTIELNGSVSSDSPLFTDLWFSAPSNPVNSALSGNGSFLGVVAGGNLSPGANVPGSRTGRLTVHQFGYGDGNAIPGTFFMDILGTTAGSDYDQLVVLSQAYLSDNLHLETDGFMPTIGDRFTIIDNRYSGSFADRFNNLPEGAIIDTTTAHFRISYHGGDGNDVVLTAVVPEPSATLTVLAAAAATLGARLPRRRRIGILRE